ncbi:MAG TPA: hypothetical protein VL155_15480 [Terriglobales bacterium]|jgi:flagellar motility protein MotE (MotC chaperone)|nr:hypothetical protein [Terriglobales bacterium]
MAISEVALHAVPTPPEVQPGEEPKTPFQKRIDKLVRAGHDKDRQIAQLEAGEYGAVLASQRKQINGLLHQLDKLNKRLRQTEEKMQAENEKWIERLTDKKAEIAALDAALAKAVETAEYYRKVRPIAPNLSRYTVKGEPAK